MQDQCIFCGASADLTDEHVISVALGGDLVLPNGTCGTCNNRFSFEFEADFINRLASIRHIVGIANRDGNIPSARICFLSAGDRGWKSMPKVMESALKRSKVIRLECRSWGLPISIS
jgi:hypothetical protein